MARNISPQKLRRIQTGSIHQTSIDADCRCSRGLSWGKIPFLSATSVPANHPQPLLFLSIFFIYKSVYRTRFRTLRDFEDSYLLDEFEQEPLAARPRGFKARVKEIWSFAK
jgi:hypothetical protein